MNGALCVLTVVAVALGVLPGLCIAPGSMYHGVQPRRAGGLDDGPSDDLGHCLKTESISSGSLGSLLPIPCKSKDGLGQTSTMQVGKEGHPSLCRTSDTTKSYWKFHSRACTHLEPEYWFSSCCRNHMLCHPACKSISGTLQALLLCCLPPLIQLSHMSHKMEHLEQTEPRQDTMPWATFPCASGIPASCWF